ncbi:chymotrypsin-like elastase family member 2A isoform X2 [Acanthaster planci]|uniref:Chymotrypsin-like elastase family member 2A isoform X2 n=1 Tax=Acanthaster planci TaxID=133434 RepID=A0A8B7YLA3_ACAPL|nr:chymotrypsin-like elastase family member 2A isoform X2 [Acanthaster planci]
MKLPVLEVCQIILCADIYTVFSAQGKELSKELHNRYFSQDHRLETREPCTLPCFRGRLFLATCKCICRRYWRGIYCQERICKPWQRGCTSKTQCVNKLKFCDRVKDCYDGSDEDNCSCTSKVCDHGGRLDKVTCTCSCTSDWTGEHCRTPSPSADCGMRQVDKSRIIGGHTADIEHYPWQVQLRYQSARSTWYFVCGGTLISPQHVVTAAHCVVDKLPTRWRVYLGRKKRQKGGEKIRDVTKVFVHEQYDVLKDTNDIALMVLNIPVSFTGRIQMACLPWQPVQQFSSDSACFISGWGSIAYGGILPYNLQAAQVVLIPQSQCADIIDLTDSMICASESLNLLGQVDACQGDSGGPLSCAAVDTQGYLRWYVVGITSYGFGCGTPGLPGVYTKVSEFTVWLEEKMNS